MQTKLISELNKVLKAFPQFWNGEELGVSLEIGNFCTLSTLFNQFGYVSD